MGRREENKQRKRERLEAEGLRLFLEHGYDRASVEQIVAASDVARGTYYLYFPDKLALFESLIDRWFAPLLEVFERVDERLGSATNRVESLLIYLEMAQELTAVALAHQEEILMGFRELRAAGEAGERLRRRELHIHEAATTITETAAKKGLITVEDPRLAALIILGAVERLHYEWLLGRDLGSPEELPGRVMRLIGRMLELPTL